MAKLKRYDIKKLLANPDLRRHLIVESTIITQAREGIDITRGQAENSYYIVTEGERTAFFGLVAFRTDAGDCDGRHVEFARTLGSPTSITRTEVALRDFSSIDGAPLAYDRLALIGTLFRNHPQLDPAFADARRGGCTGDDEKLVRCWWEQPLNSPQFKPFAKGGPFSRFYADVYLKVAWDDTRDTFRGFYGRKGRETERPESLDFYFRPGLTWSRRTAKGLSTRRLPAGCVFADKGPGIFPRQRKQEDYILGVTNSRLFEFLFMSRTSFSWEVGIMKSMPIPSAPQLAEAAIGALSRRIYDIKRAWDTANEVCTSFDRPWLLQPTIRGTATALARVADAILSREASLDFELKDAYCQLNEAVYRVYGVNDVLRARIEAAIGERPPEITWPQMEGKSTEQKRMEHVFRLLSYTVKCVLEEDDDGLVSLQSVAQERPLLERVRSKLATFFPEQDPHSLEIEVVNELKKRVKGYGRAESLHDWLTSCFFDFHCGLYQQRPIFWHLASSQESAEPAFSVIAHYHRFDLNRLTKLRSVHVRDRLATLRREAGQAGKDKREDDRLQLLEAVEEVEAFDRKLARLQEGHHAGTEGGNEDYRILTPWKKPEDRPQGWRPDIDDGVKVNIAPLARTGLLRIKNTFGAKDAED